MREDIPLLAEHFLGKYAEQMEKFKTKLNPEYCVGAPLRAIGITDERLAA